MECARYGSVMRMNRGIGGREGADERMSITEDDAFDVKLRQSTIIRVRLFVFIRSLAF